MIMTAKHWSTLKESSLNASLSATSPTWEPKRIEENVVGEYYVQRKCVIYAADHSSEIRTVGSVNAPQMWIQENLLILCWGNLLGRKHIEHCFPTFFLWKNPPPRIIFHVPRNRYAWRRFRGYEKVDSSECSSVTAELSSETFICKQLIHMSLHWEKNDSFILSFEWCLEFFVVFWSFKIVYFAISHGTPNDLRNPVWKQTYLLTYLLHGAESFLRS